MYIDGFKACTVKAPFDLPVDTLLAKNCNFWAFRTRGNLCGLDVEL